MISSANLSIGGPSCVGRALARRAGPAEATRSAPPSTAGGTATGTHHGKRSSIARSISTPAASGAAKRQVGDPQETLPLVVEDKEHDLFGESRHLWACQGSWCGFLRRYRLPPRFPPPRTFRAGMPLRQGCASGRRRSARLPSVALRCSSGEQPCYFPFVAPAGPAPRRSRCSAGFIRGLWAVRGQNRPAHQLPNSPARSIMPLRRWAALRQLVRTEDCAMVATAPFDGVGQWPGVRRRRRISGRAEASM